MNITLDTIRQLEIDAGNFANSSDFGRHADAILASAYDGVKLTDGGGLLRTREAIAIDRALSALFREAGYTAEMDYELGDEIWARVRGEG